MPICYAPVRRFSITVTPALKWRTAAILPALVVIITRLMTSPDLWVPVSRGRGPESSPALDGLLATACLFAGWIASCSTQFHEMLSHIQGWGYRPISSDAGQATVVLWLIRYGCLLLLWLFAYSLVFGDAG